MNATTLAEELLHDLEFDDVSVQEEAVEAVLRHKKNRVKNFAYEWSIAVEGRLSSGDCDDDLIYRFFQTDNVREVADSSETPTHILDFIIQNSTSTIIRNSCFSHPNVRVSQLRENVKYRETWASIVLNPKTPGDVLEQIQPSMLSDSSLKKYSSHVNLPHHVLLQMLKKNPIQIWDSLPIEPIGKLVRKFTEEEVNLLAEDADRTVLYMCSAHPDLRVEFIREIGADIVRVPFFWLIENRNLDFGALKLLYHTPGPKEFPGFDEAKFMDRLRAVPEYETYPDEWLEALLQQDVEATEVVDC